MKFEVERDCCGEYTPSYIIKNMLYEALGSIRIPSVACVGCNRGCYQYPARYMLVRKSVYWIPPMRTLKELDAYMKKKIKSVREVEDF